MCKMANLMSKLQSEVDSRADIDPRGYDLISQALTEAALLRTDCEIEQMVRGGNAPSVRQRVQVQFDRDGTASDPALHVTLERDGEVVGRWLVQNYAEILELLDNSERRTTGQFTDLFTAIYTDLHAAQQFLSAEELKESQSLIDRIIPRMREFWLKSKDHSRPCLTVNLTPSTGR